MKDLSPVTVFYDNECSLCRSLAQFMARQLGGEDISFISWQEYRRQQLCPPEFQQLKADTLRVWNGKTLLSSDEAWAFLLENHPQLSALNWVSKKLGISKQVSSTLRWTGQTARKICFRCRK